MGDICFFLVENRIYMYMGNKIRFILSHISTLFLMNRLEVFRPLRVFQRFIKCSFCYFVRRIWRERAFYSGYFVFFLKNLHIAFACIFLAQNTNTFLFFNAYLLKNNICSTV